MARESHTAGLPQRSLDPPSTGAAPHSFLVYPVPSIADESFVQLIFRNTVKRSLFLGFGRGRFAVVELTGAEVASAVETILQAAAAEIPGQESVGVPQSDLDCAADNDAVEQMTLADLFSPPVPSFPSPASVSAAESKVPDFSHLPYLVWRDRPVHVVVSGVSVSDFYETGGTVPEHHVKRSADAAGEFSNRTPKAPKGGKRPRSDVGATAESAPSSWPAEDLSQDAAQHARGAGPVVPAATKTTFPKHCCQKCGSAHHFTRHCDGSGTSSTPNAGEGIAEVAGHSADVHVTPEPQREALSAAVGTTVASSATTTTTPVVYNTLKDRCKHCGSDAHLSRHCPSKK